MDTNLFVDPLETLKFNAGSFIVGVQISVLIVSISLTRKELRGGCASSMGSLFEVASKHWSVRCSNLSSKVAKPKRMNSYCNSDFDFCPFVTFFSMLT